MQARTQVLVSVASGILAAVPTSVLTGPELGSLVGWDTASAVYLAWVWLTVWPLDGGLTARRAEHQDPTRATADLLLLSAAVASLGAVGLVLAGAASGTASPQPARIALGVLSVVVSWAVVHTVFTLRYARLYYEGADGGVDFSSGTRPSYSDFAYLAFTIGMTFQVSDTGLQTALFRRTALRHALLSYLFGTGVLAVSVNLVASLTSKSG